MKVTLYAFRFTIARSLKIAVVQHMHCACTNIIQKLGKG